MVTTSKFKDIKDAKELQLTLETKDQALMIGPGWATKHGYIIGVAVAVDGWEVLSN